MTIIIHIIGLILHLAPLMAALGMFVLAIYGELEWPMYIFGVAFVAMGTLLFNGCAAQPPPPQPIILTQPQPPIMKPLPPPIPPDPRVGLSPVVLQAIADPTHPTVQQGDVTFHAYDKYAHWTLTCAPVMVTKIILNDDETFEQAMVGGTVRWGVQGQDHTVAIKALGDSSDPNMKTNVVISTTKRSYSLLVRLGRFTPAVAWYYPEDFQIALNAHNAALKGK